MDLSIKTRAGIALELIERLYDTPARKLREAVANALDAQASSIDIIVDPGKDHVDLEDNGHGMDLETFREEFLTIGGSDKRGTDSIGRIGIGALATFFGDSISISSCTADGRGFKAELQVDTLRDEANRRQPLHVLSVGTATEVQFPAGRAHTKITISKLRPEFVHCFWDEGLSQLHWDLTRILPLAYSPDSPLFRKLRETREGQEVADYLMSPKHRTIEVRLNGTRLVRRCYGEGDRETIREILPIPGHKVGKLTIWGYAIGGESKLLPAWQGLVTRVKNVAVEESGYLYMSKGSSERERVTGELHVEGIDDNVAINLDRTKFNATNPNVIALCALLDRDLHPFLKKVYQRSKQEAHEKRQVKEHQRMIKELTVQSLPTQIDQALPIMAEKLMLAASVVSDQDPKKGIEPVLSFLGYEKQDLSWRGSPEETNVVVYSGPSNPALVLDVVKSHQEWDYRRRDLFSNMDMVGSAVGVLSDGVRWQVWSGRGPEKRQMAEVSMTKPDEHALAAVRLMSKPTRWAQERVDRHTATPTGTPTIYGYVLALADQSALIDLIEEAATISESYGFTRYDWEEEVGYAPASYFWFPESHPTRVKVRTILTGINSAVLLSASKPTLAYWKNTMCRRASARPIALLESLRDRFLPGQERFSVLGCTEDLGDEGVVTRVFRRPKPIASIGDQSRLLSLWVQGRGLPSLTVFSNGSFALPASDEPVFEGQIEEILDICGSGGAGFDF